MANAQVKLPYYDSMSSFREGFSFVRVNNMVGIINDDFDEVIPPLFEDIRCYDFGPFHFQGIFFGFRGDSTILFDTLGVIKKVVMDKDLWPHNYFPIEDYKFRISDLVCNTYSPSSSPPNCGCIRDSNVVIPQIYNGVYRGVANQIIAQTYNREETFFYNVAGELLATYKKPFGINLHEELSRYWIKQAGLFICVDSAFNVIYESDFDHVKDAVDTLICVSKNGKWGIMNQDFKIVVAIIHEDIGLNKHWGYVKKDGYYGITNKKGELITEFIYRSTGSYSQYMTENEKITAIKGDQIVILDSNGICIANCQSLGSINKTYPNGDKWVTGQFDNYWKSGTWNYYRNDSVNSKEESIRYTDSLVYYTDFDSLEQVSWEHSEKRKQMIKY
jgi:hypothetical protein